MNTDLTQFAGNKRKGSESLGHSGNMNQSNFEIFSLHKLAKTWRKYCLWTGGLHRKHTRKHANTTPRTGTEYS